MTNLRLQLSSRMKEVCTARVEREQAQSMRYTGAAHFIQSIRQTNSTGYHATNPNSTITGHEHGIGNHNDVFNGTPQATRSSTDGTNLYYTDTVGINSHVQYANSCTGTRCSGGCASSSSSNSMHHDEPSFHNPDVNGVYWNGASEATTTTTTATDPSRMSNPFTNSNNESGDGAQESILRGPVVEALYRSTTGSSQQTTAWRPAAHGLATVPPPRRHLHDNWRQRDDPTPTAFRTVVLDVKAEEENQPEQPPLLERLRPSLPDPEPWQVKLYREKDWSLATLVEVFDQTIPTVSWPPSELIQMLRRKHGDSWPGGDDEDEGSEGSEGGVLTPATLAADDSFAEFQQQDVPMKKKKRKTLLDIYHEAKKEVALREQGPSHTLQFGNMTAIELSASIAS
ncbi:hypothetical protein CTA2_2045 [Colletotrichum tanaceti]|uniref:Uncharacterized protein n=1 Tax=Colletotrichum tanaceti TaxID=1306861 RepID=A0A4U6X990_9PEZI|nr:hypothetical protein CTA2_2045 [Colletotrichum tanaceti]TKW52160.1 hypothetical protein CTA1_10519 [Colletotrichum tanaceti]